MKRASNKMAVREIPSIPGYYSEQSIFITGGTGLMGKVLVEKILRSCPEVANIYILIRPKKGMSIQDRWAKITKLPLFEKLHSERPETLEKVILIPGNIGEAGLGLSEINKKVLRENVTLLYHGAAMIQFTDRMGDAIHQNLGGTCEVLEFSKSLNKLKTFVHISTAYSNSDRPSKEAIEQILPACQDWRVILKIFENHPLEVEALKEKLLCGHPNPYTWTKSLAEHAVNSYRNHFPIIIIRPSLVCGSIEDPLSGWIDALNGLSAISSACCYGYLHVLPTDPYTYIDQVPIDFAIKACIIAPWKQHTNYQNGEDKTIEVYNCAYGKSLDPCVTFKDLERIGAEILEECPSAMSVWEQSIIYVQNLTIFNILFFIYQVLPSVLIDLILTALRKKTRAVKLTIKGANAFRLVSKLLKEPIAFPNDKFICLGQCINQEDKEAFFYPPALRDSMVHTRNIIIGHRKYCWKEDLSAEAIENNRKRINRIKLLKKIITGTIFLSAMYYLSICLWSS